MAHEHAGQSIIEMLWEQLDLQYAKLMERRKEEDFTTVKKIAEMISGGDSTDNSIYGDKHCQDVAEKITSYFELKGKVAGLAYAIAKLRNPFGPDLDAIRKECAERWKG